MKVLLPREAALEELGPLPDGVELTAERAPDVEVAVLHFGVSRSLPEVFAELPALRVIQTLNAGVEWLLPAVPRGVTVCNASGVHDIPVAEWCVAAILALTRRLPDFWRLQAERRWDADVNPMGAGGESPLGPIDDLDGKQVLVVGHGSIGRALEARLEPFGARIVGVARHERPGVHTVEELPELLLDADVVVLLLPLTEETRGLVDARFLDSMRPGALLVNAARGPLVDTGALEERLRAGRLRAALDVTDPEPLPPEHSLWSAPNLLITPHVGGATTQWEARAYRFVGDQLRRLAAGEPPLNVRTVY
ncbi:MAG: 2-hydroxyacid dehydrogenase [Actinobacteria bacterium]|nr:2-hydroxyacid dehydrogenase [Actinomycetota bacterium]